MVTWWRFLDKVFGPLKNYSCLCTMREQCRVCYRIFKEEGEDDNKV